MLTESPSNGRKGREKMAQVMFESFEVSQIFIAKTQTLALFATGKTTGIVHDIGGHSIYTVPMWDGKNSNSCLQ